jgi:hypothetical protein
VANTQGSTQLIPAPVTWIAPDGARHTGEVPVYAGAQAGSPVPVWIDAHGDQAGQPLTTEQAYWRGVLTTAAVLAMAIGVLAGAVRLVRLACDRRRRADWAREWDEVEPRWNQRGEKGRNAP